MYMASMTKHLNGYNLINRLIQTVIFFLTTMNKEIFSKRTTFSSLRNNELKNIKKVPLFNVLTKKNVSIYVVSNLINFTFENKYLQECCSLLQHRLSKKYNIFHNITMKTIKGLAYSNPALSIKIINNDIIKYEAVFLSLSDQYEGDKKSTPLPLLCVLKDSGKTFKNIIHRSLEKLFSCSIRPCTINNNKFLWLIGIGVNESVMKKRNDGIIISFALPNFTNKAVIQLHLTEESLENLWLASRSEERSNIIKLNEIEAFYFGLLEHINKTYGFNMEECIVKSIILKGIKFISGEKFQMFVSSEETIYSILSFLLSDCTTNHFFSC